jgi:hypothetical protein
VKAVTGPLNPAAGVKMSCPVVMERLAVPAVDGGVDTRV